MSICVLCGKPDSNAYATVEGVFADVHEICLVKANGETRRKMVYRRARVLRRIVRLMRWLATI